MINPEKLSYNVPHKSPKHLICLSFNVLLLDDLNASTRVMDAFKSSINLQFVSLSESYHALSIDGLLTTSTHHLLINGI